MTSSLPPEYRGWWRIVDTGTWVLSPPRVAECSAATPRS
jgi:hypothetical protein